MRVWLKLKCGCATEMGLLLCGRGASVAVWSRRESMLSGRGERVAVWLQWESGCVVEAGVYAELGCLNNRSLIDS